MSKKLKIVLSILILISIAVVSSLFFLKTPRYKHEVDLFENPLVTLEHQFFPTPPADTLPEDTTQIPKEEWKKNNEVLAVRALKYFEQKGLATAPLSEKEVEERKPILLDWGKPWKLHFLKNQLNDQELKLVWDEELVLFTDSPEEFAEQEKKVREQLARVKPSVEVEESQFTGYYKTQMDVDKAINEGILAKVTLTNVKTGENLFTNAKLVNSVHKIDDALSESNGIYEVSSATRPLELQELLRKLGYPAAKASFHNLGKAIDFKLSKEAAKRFADFLNEKLPGSSGTVTTRMEKIDQMVKTGTYPTMEILIARGSLPKDHELAKT